MFFPVFGQLIEPEGFYRVVRRRIYAPLRKHMCDTRYRQ